MNTLSLAKAYNAAQAQVERLLSVPVKLDGTPDAYAGITWAQVRAYLQRTGWNLIPETDLVRLWQCDCRNATNFPESANWSVLFLRIYADRLSAIEDRSPLAVLEDILQEEVVPDNQKDGDQ